MNKLFLTLWVAASVALPLAAPMASHAASHAGAAPASAAAADMTEGEIRKVDKDTQKISIKHGEIRNLDMPAMSMLFRVKDPAMLDQVKAGDKVKFKAEKLDGAFTVTEIQLAR
jgi:Cu(I)/Ag(I) efflux system periplasmic protein CusF